MLNRFDHFRAEVDGFGLHFMHERGEGPNPLPIVLTHGWPDSRLFEEAADGPRTPAGGRGPAVDARYGLEIGHESVGRLCEEHGLGYPGRE